MKVENHILEILQLYEYAMAIGKSLNYKESCDSFLKLILKRKSLNAAWILEPHNNVLKSTYALPFGKDIKSNNQEVLEKLNKIQNNSIVETTDLMSSIAPISISTGKTIIFNLNNHGFLFLYSRKDNITSKDLNQLSPVIQKFAVHLKACRAFKEQEQLLYNLEVQNQELSDYAHMVSHDLKSPLRSIDALTSWLKEDYGELLNDTGKNQINTIRSSVEKMDTLINGILEYSTIGKTIVEIFDVDLNLLIDEILIMIQIPKNIDIEKSILPVVKGDKYRLQQLFQNLISNSIAYNDKEKGKIEIGVEDKDQFWEFYVKDNGKGIEEKYFEKIFKTFQKLENNQKSTGIGLSVVKKIVDLYGGDIWLTSELGKGTSFNFTLKKEPNGTA